VHEPVYIARLLNQVDDPGVVLVKVVEDELVALEPCGRRVAAVDLVHIRGQLEIVLRLGRALDDHARGDFLKMGIQP
jgi:hypothetical protein